MLEILGIILLSNTNKKNALSRGRKPGGFVALTILLWIGMEILGLMLGFLLGSRGLAYLFGLCFALLGGLISYLAAKNCRPGDTMYPPNVYYNPAQPSFGSPRVPPYGSNAAQTPARPPEMPPYVRFCVSCGKEAPPEAQYCTNCGAPV